jgi:hypothetical protein
MNKIAVIEEFFVSSRNLIRWSRHSGCLVTQGQTLPHLKNSDVLSDYRIDIFEERRWEGKRLHVKKTLVYPRYVSDMKGRFGRGR